MVHWYTSLGISMFHTNQDIFHRSWEFRSERRFTVCNWREKKNGVKVLVVANKCIDFFMYLFFKAADISLTLWWGLICKYLLGKYVPQKQWYLTLSPIRKLWIKNELFLQKQILKSNQVHIFYARDDWRTIYIDC